MLLKDIIYNKLYLKISRSPKSGITRKIPFVANCAFGDVLSRKGKEASVVIGKIGRGYSEAWFTEDRAAFRSIPSNWNRCIIWSQVTKTSVSTRRHATLDVSIAITGPSLNLLQSRSGPFAIGQRRSSRKHYDMDVDQYPTVSTNLRSFMN